MRYPMLLCPQIEDNEQRTEIKKSRRRGIGRLLVAFSVSSVYVNPLPPTDFAPFPRQLTFLILYRWVGKDVEELNVVTRNLISDCDIKSYESVKNLCDRYNKAIDRILQLRKGIARPSGTPLRPCNGLLKHILQQCYVRAVLEPEKLNQYEPFSPEVYGETSYELVEQMLKYIKKDFSDDCLFIDLGSGVGQVVLQVAASTTVKRCIGIEKAEYPSSCAINMQIEFRKWMSWFGKTFSEFEIIRGDFIDEQFRDSIREADVLFVNNFAFGPRVDLELKERFNDMKEGAKIVSSKAFCPLNFRINDRALKDVASILTVEELTPMSGNVSWTCKPVTFTLHTVNRSMLEDYFKGLKNPSMRQEEEKIVRKDRKGRVIGSYTNGVKLSGQVGEKQSNGDKSTSERRCSTSSTDGAKNDLFGPTTRRQWNEWVRSNTACQPSSNEDNERQENENRKKREKKDRKRSRRRPLLTVASKKVQANAQKKKALGMDALNLFHNHTLMSSQGGQQLDSFNCKVMTNHLKDAQSAPAQKEQNLPSVAVVPTHRPAIPVNQNLPPELVESIDQFYESQRQQAVEFFKYAQSEQYVEAVEQELKKEREKNNSLKQTLQKLEKQSELLTKDGLDKLKSRLSECHVNAQTPSEFLSKAKDIVTKFKCLNQKLDQEQQTVNKLDQERIKLLEMRKQEQKSIVSSGNLGLDQKPAINSKLSAGNPSLGDDHTKSQRERITMKLDIRQPDKVKVLGAKADTKAKKNPQNLTLVNDPYSFVDSETTVTKGRSSVKSDLPVLTQALLGKSPLNRIASATKRTSTSPIDPPPPIKEQKRPKTKDAPSRPSSSSSTLSADSNPSVPTSPRAKLLPRSKSDQDQLVDKVKDALLPHDRSKPAFAPLTNQSGTYLPPPPPHHPHPNIMPLLPPFFIPPYPSSLSSSYTSVAKKSNGMIKHPKQSPNGWEQVSSGLDVLFAASSERPTSSPNGEGLSNSLGSCSVGQSRSEVTDQDNDSTKYDKHFKKKLFMRQRQAAVQNTKQAKFKPKGKDYPRESDATDSLQLIKIFSPLPTFLFYATCRLEAALIDLSGTLHIDNEPTRNAVSSLHRLRESGVKVKFVTNTTKESLSSLYNRLINIGFSIDKNEIYTSLTAAKNYITENKIRPLLLLDDDAKKDFDGVVETEPNGVVVGLSPKSFNYDTLNKAFRLLLHGHPLIAIHKARYFKKADGLYLGPGPFVSALEYASNAKPILIGKPNESFFQEALSQLNCQANKTVMIGDDVHDDLEGASKIGMKSVLVKTGKYREKDECKIPNFRPTCIVNDFSESVEWIIDQNLL
ncbi:DgyrCDS1135 [Dimorphilus gyrociliatus]|uniref:Histone-lysine N-methyltransferase, H3 lysine-79 specific n=1 Tax=Dimorphilus gyrociliatus TaxID=2664684 RepID=A0A7I8V8F2_9ANNE|nr:DgyrCDS1135 [Dimorphilus gyrociliatus]